MEDTTPEKESKLSLFQSIKGDISSPINQEEISKLTDYLEYSSKSHILPVHQRSAKSTILTSSPSQWTGQDYEYAFEVKRKVTGLPSLWFNKMQHSGSHFIAGRMNMLGYVNCRLQSHENPWMDRGLMSEFIQGGYISLCELPPNLYNIHLFERILKESPTKVILHFRDPRSIMVSAPHLMYSKGKTPEEIHEESLKYPDGIIPLDFPEKPYKERLNYYMLKYFARWADFVNGWSKALTRLKGSYRKNLLITEFNRHLSDSSENYLKNIIRFIGDGNTVTIPTNYFDKTLNSHWRRGLKDEWREVCTKDQIKWMTDQIHPRTLEFFKWDKE